MQLVPRIHPHMQEGHGFLLGLGLGLGRGLGLGLGLEFGLFGMSPLLIEHIVHLFLPGGR